MTIHNFDGKQYIALGDLNHLRRNLIQDIRDKYERGEDGQIHMEPEDVGQIGAYSHLMVEILKDQLAVAREEATDSESLRKNYDRVYDRIKREFEEDKYAIVATDKTQGEKKIVYYARTDEDKDGKQTPVFTDERRKAEVFDDHYIAQCRLDWLKEHTKDMGAAVDNLHIEGMWLVWMDGNAQKRLLDAIFGEGDGPWCIFLEADPDDDSDAPSWFAEWIKYIDDMPQGIKDWLEQAHVEPGESVPMFSSGGGDVMTFAYKGMAEKTAEKIADMYPQFKGRLRVTKRLNYVPSEDDLIADGIGQAFNPD